MEAADRSAFLPTVLVGLLVVGILGNRLLFGFLARRAIQQENKMKAIHGGRRRPRAFSYTSNAMVAGSFPPASLMPETIINAVVWFDECPNPNELADQVVTPMLQYTRLNSVPDAAASSTRPSSTHYKAIDLVRVVEVEKGEDDDASIYQEIFRHMQDPLTKDRGDLPWWEVLVVRRGNGATTTKKKGRAAAVFRIHHGLADGISLVKVFGDIVKHQDGTSAASMLQNFTSKRVSTPRRQRGFLRELWVWLRELFNVLTLGMTRYDDDTAFSKHNHSRMTYSGNRQAIIFPTIPLNFVKAIKNAASVTINDVLMAAVSQAIVDYCAHQNCPIVTTSDPSHKQRRIQCRALLPVAFPRPEEQMNDPDAALSNKWCFFSTDLGLDIADVLDRLQYIHTNNLDIKSTPRVFLQLSIQNKLLPYLPAVIGQQTLFDIMSRHSLVFSNVPGPDRPVLIAGKVVSGVQMLYANLIPQIGFLSYAGNVYGNIMLDPGTLPDSHRLAHFYVGALRTLANRLNVPVPPDL